MKNDCQLEKEAGRIADEIVRLVERTNGPVTLVQVRSEIPGFAANELLSGVTQSRMPAERSLIGAG
jgi:hypothetical protein